MNQVANNYHINTPLRMCAFLAQVGVESGNFKYTSENLNYSAKGLRSTFPKYFPTDALANTYARQPEKIANRVYANRMGNGDESSGDGWKYRGRGLIQITGKNNYISCLKFLNQTDPAFLETQTGAVLSAGWYWATNNLNRWADARDMASLTRAINGGLNGYSDRVATYDRCTKYIH